jgi:hypothetical protein
VLAVDASDVVEKGRIGETYRPRYAIDLHTMTSGTFKLEKHKEGEAAATKVTDPSLQSLRLFRYPLCGGAASATPPALVFYK